MNAAPPLLELTRISKAFPGVLANDSIDIAIPDGQIHALLGENGAGKSTLVKIIYGYYTPDAGQIRWRGKSVTVANPAQAREMGIGMVFQHFSLFDAMTVRENIELAIKSGKKPAELADQISQVSENYGLGLDPQRDIFTLSVGERQRVEIVRCLLQSPKLLIMDEPTSVLTPQEAEKLFDVLRKLSKEGCAVLYISHKLEEIQTLCHHATILRQGKVVAECDPTEQTTRNLAEMMIGKTLKPPSYRSRNVGQPIFEVRNLTRAAENERSISLDQISFSVCKGEIFGIAGVAGNGQTELMDMLSGEVLANDNAAIAINGTDCGKSSVRVRRRLGAAMVPEERLGHGAVGSMSLIQNVFLSGHSHYQLAARQWMNFSNAKRYAQETCDEFDVRHAGIITDAGSLSGGNLQKFLIGREILQQPSVMLASQPTWGVDAGSQIAIHKALLELAGSGTAVLVISQDLDELMELCTRIAVMFSGKLSKAYPIAELNAERIGLLMGGATFESTSGCVDAN